MLYVRANQSLQVHIIHHLSDCDYALQNPGVPVDLTECNFPCSGDETELCGAGNRINVFYSGKPGPSILRRFDTHKYQACYAYVQLDLSSVRLDNDVTHR